MVYTVLHQIMTKRWFFLFANIVYKRKLIFPFFLMVLNKYYYYDFQQILTYNTADINLFFLYLVIRSFLIFVNIILTFFMIFFSILAKLYQIGLVFSVQVQFFRSTLEGLIIQVAQIPDEELLEKQRLSLIS